MYAITQQEAPTVPDVITNIFIILDQDANVLIDPGSTCSFIAYDFVLRINDIVKPLEYDICVSMPAGGVVSVSTIIRNCPITIFKIEDDRIYDRHFKNKLLKI